MRAMHYDGAPLAITDLLDIEGGEWSTEQIAQRLRMNKPRIQRALQRLQKRGLVTKRMVQVPLPYKQRALWRST